VIAGERHDFLDNSVTGRRNRCRVAGGPGFSRCCQFQVARTYPVARREHEIKLVDPRYEEITKKVTVAAGKKTIIKETMKPVPLAKPPFGFLRTENADHFAAVYINDKYYGHVDEFSNFAQKLLLPPGEYEVKIVPLIGTNPVTQKVKIEAEKTTIVK
jgi:hypothetical protein